MLRSFQVLPPLILGAIAVAVTGTTAQAAERISFQFGILGDSLAVDSLRAFAQEGTVDAELAAFLNFVPPQAQAKLREGLTQTIESSDAVATPHSLYSQWLYSPMGDRVLDYAGSIIQMPSGRNGKVALRAAIVLAGSEPGGATPLGIMESFPAAAIRIDLVRAWRDWQRVQAAAKADLAVLERVKAIAAAEAATSPVDVAALPSLEQPGAWAVEHQTLIWEDPKRQRRFPVELYQPENLGTSSGPLPVVVMSHGYAINRKYFVDLGHHLASHGVVVVTPEHIGSNYEQRLALEAGRAQESFLTSEFIDRPLDVTAVLDELERRNVRDYQGRLQLDRVALVGHSMGGYTVLVASGATVDLDHLRRRCLEPFIELDTALLLVCRALELPEHVAQSLTDGSLKDDRVQLVMTLSPVASLFGEQGLEKVTIPTLMVAGVYDLAAPIVPEQVEPFGWLRTAEKYLYIVDRWSHEADVTRGVWSFLDLEDQWGQSFDQANPIFQANLGAALVAAVDVYVRDRESSRAYLSSGYVEAVSEEDALRMHLVRSLTP